MDGTARRNKNPCREGCFVYGGYLIEGDNALFGPRYEDLRLLLGELESRVVVCALARVLKLHKVVSEILDLVWKPDGVRLCAGVFARAVAEASIDFYPRLIRSLTPTRAHQCICAYLS